MHHMSPGEHPLIDRVCQTAFPEYKGRKIGVSYTYGPLDLRSYWEGGSRTDWVVLDGASMRKLVMPPQSAYDPKIAGADAFMLPPGAIVVAHVISCGVDAGLTIYARPDGIQFLPGPAVELTETERLVLLATRSFTASYRREVLGRRGIREEQAVAARTSLQAKGLLDGRGAVTNAGKNLLGREQWQYQEGQMKTKSRIVREKQAAEDAAMTAERKATKGFAAAEYHAMKRAYLWSATARFYWARVNA